MAESKELHTATKKVAEFIAETTKDRMPPEALMAAKNAFLDYMGVAIGGSSEQVSKIIYEYVKESSGKEEANVIRKGFKTSAELSAFANGTFGHALDYDDTIPTSVHYNLHPSVGIIPAVLALGEKYNVSGTQVLASYIVGLEVQYRVGLAMGKYIAPSGWHSTSVLGSIGSAAAAANLLKLDISQAQMALGIVGSLTGGLTRNLDTNTKPMHAGNAARNGVLAAKLARIGYTSNPDILDGELSFCSMFSGYQTEELGNQADDLGKEWNIINRGLTFKPWPCCRATHGNIEAVLNMREIPGMDINLIESIVSKTVPMLVKFASRHRPVNGYEGKFSIGYCMAAALTGGQVVLEDFTDEKVKDPVRQSLAAKCSYVHPENWGTGMNDPKVEVTIKLKDGSEYSELIISPKGEPENPLTDIELKNKFLNCTGSIPNKDQVERLYETLMNMEKIKDINELSNIINA
jgi:2-methylcitrate dehydratase PrpD